MKKKWQEESLQVTFWKGNEGVFQIERKRKIGIQTCPFFLLHVSHATHPPTNQPTKLALFV